ncbi:MAG: disulfide bond formation protein DsbB [Candidatus Nomurabacteria bacterium]|nr:disulfide bond formation protein DsbB [Candidatus Nomurabacteria bacterium]
MTDNTAQIASLNHLLSAGTIILLVIGLIWLVAIIANWKKGEGAKFLPRVANYVFPIGFITSLAGLVGSLYYSEVLGILPCDLCWFQRVFLYPQAFMFAYAWYKKDSSVLAYSIILSTLGLLIGAYQHVMQLGYSVYRPCSTAPFAVDCSTPTFIEYGFVTFPLMAVVLFAILILIAVTHKRFAKRQ